MDRPDVDRDPRVARTPVAEGSQTNSKAVITRRAAIGGAVGGAMVTLLARPELATADERLKKPIVVLLRGLYHPVAHGPDLGLSTVDLSDGSYSTTKIYPVSGVPGGETNVLTTIGDFYAQFTGNLCAYDLPEGAIAMEFTGSNTAPVPDGSGGSFLQGTYELTILEATGRYRSYVGGHNRMVDDLHFLASGEVDEFCFCLISHSHSPDG